jgi:hypothetical protein
MLLEIPSGLEMMVFCSLDLIQRISRKYYKVRPHVYEKNSSKLDLVVGLIDNKRRGNDLCAPACVRIM